MKSHTLLRGVLACALSCACREEAPARRVAQAATFHGDVAGRDPDELVVDLHANGDAIVGRVLPALENSDPDRVLSLRRTGGARFAEHALDAKIVGEATTLWLATDHTLRLRGASDERVIDRDVYGPLALSDDRTRVVYTRGHVPELEVVRAELASAVTTPVAPGMVPAWCPTWAGDDVVFVASPDGSPSLYRRHGAQPPTAIALERGAAFPTGPSAPFVMGTTLIFEDARGLHTRSLTDATHTELPGVHHPLAWTASQVVLVHRGDGRGTELVPLVLGGGAR